MNVIPPMSTGQIVSIVGSTAWLSVAFYRAISAFLKFRDLRAVRTPLHRRIKNLLGIDTVIFATDVDIEGAHFSWSDNETTRTPQMAIVSLRDPMSSGALRSFSFSGKDTMFDIVYSIRNYQTGDGPPSDNELVYMIRKYSLNRMKVRFWHLMRRLHLKKPGASFQRILDSLPTQYSELRSCKKNATTFRIQTDQYRQRVAAEYAAGANAMQEEQTLRQQRMEIEETASMYWSARGGLKFEEKKPKTKARMPGDWANNLVLNARVEDLKTMQQAKINEQQAHDQDIMNRAYENSAGSGVSGVSGYHGFSGTPYVGYTAPELPFHQDQADNLVYRRRRSTEENTWGRSLNANIQVEVDMTTDVIRSITERTARIPTVIYMSPTATALMSPANIIVYTNAEIETIEVMRDVHPIHTMGNGSVRSFREEVRGFVVTLTNREVYRT